MASRCRSASRVDALETLDGAGEALIHEINALTAAVREVLAAPRYREAARRAGATAANVADPVRVCHDALGAAA